MRSSGTTCTAALWRYRYDGHGHLRNTANDSYQSQTSYYPDALGERFWTVHYDIPTGPQTTLYTYSDGLRPEVIQELTYSRSNNTTSTWTSTGTRTYVLGPMPDERLIYRAANGQVYYPHTDRRGSTVALSQAGQAAETYAYDEFGRSGSTGPSGYPYRYTGQRLDPWTGTYHYKAREYSPQLGRFLQADPARFVDGPNVYAYVGNNPWNATDPTGREGWAVSFRDQPIATPWGSHTRLLGHAGFVYIDNDTGAATYWEFGRGYEEQFPGSPNGAIRTLDVSDLVRGADGNWTAESRASLLADIQAIGVMSSSVDVEITTNASIDFGRNMGDVLARYNSSAEYRINPAVGLTNCYTFVQDMWRAGGGLYRLVSDTAWTPRAGMRGLMGQRYSLGNSSPAEIAQQMIIDDNRDEESR